jgi:hypothetical protein
VTVAISIAQAISPKPSAQLTPASLGQVTEQVAVRRGRSLCHRRLGDLG